jgi:hypothetical protein
MGALGLGVEIREDTITGPIVGTSVTRYYAPRITFVGEAHLTFTEPISLKPGQRYVIKPYARGSLGTGFRIELGVPQADTYPPYENGRWIYYGQPISGRDMWFRQGYVVPEPKPLWLLPLALASIFFTRGLVSPSGLIQQRGEELQLCGSALFESLRFECGVSLRLRLSAQAPAALIRSLPTSPRPDYNSAGEHGLTIPRKQHGHISNRHHRRHRPL